MLALCNGHAALAGFCGLVPVCDENEFKEWGVVRPLHREHDVAAPPGAPSPVGPEQQSAGRGVSM